MKKIFLIKQTVYVAEDGNITKLGNAEKLEHITGNVFKGSQTYVIKDNKVSTLSKDAYPMPVVSEFKDTMPQELKDLRDDHRTLAKHLNEKLSKTIEKYYQMCAEFSQKDFENLTKNAVVLKKGQNISLFIQNKKGDYVENKNVVPINFEECPAFIYKGGLYAKDFNQLIFNRIDFKPLIVAPGYIILWGGNKNIFAMELDDNNSVKFTPLGIFDGLIKTNVNQLIRVGDEFSGYKLYHLGKKLEYVFSFGEIKECIIYPEKGGIIHDYIFTLEGYDYPTEHHYKLVNGSYKQDY